MYVCMHVCMYEGMNERMHASSSLDPSTASASLGPKSAAQVLRWLPRLGEDFTFGAQEVLSGL